MHAIRLSAVLVPALLVAGCAMDSSDPATSSSESELSSNAHTAFNYFVARGLTKRQSAGIIGNLIQESSVSPTAVEYGGGPGRGIAQWSVGGRWDHSYHDNVAWYAANHGLSRWSLGAQLRFTWYELATFSGFGLHALRSTTTITGATLAFERDFEKCGTCDQSRRITYAQQVYNAYASSARIECYSPTLDAVVPDGTRVQSADDGGSYTCDDGDWVNADLVGAVEGDADVAP